MDITANLVTAEQLSNFATGNYGTDRATKDQWCYMVRAITGAPCPDTSMFGDDPTVNTSAEDFLDRLRQFQLGVNATYQGPGGSDVQAGTTAAQQVPNTSTVTGASVVGVGLFGPTNCQFCIWLKKNPWVLVLAVAAIYFGFFYEK